MSAPAGEGGTDVVAASAHVDRHRETNRERQEQLRHLQEDAFQFANYYIVVQVIIFISCYSTPSDLRCRYPWIPFSLSLVAGFLILCVLSYVAFKYKTTLDDMDKAVINVVGDNPTSSTSGSTAVRCERFRGLLYVSSMTLLIGVFVIITLIGSWKITCPRSEIPAKPPSPAST